MTIASEITKLNTNLEASYTTINSKGGTLPQAQNFDNLSIAISTIPSGGSAPVISPLTITPMTLAQTITAQSGTDGYSPITVEPITCVDCLPLGHPSGGALNYAYSYNTSTMIKFVSYATSILNNNIFGNYLRNCNTLISFSMPNLVSVDTKGLQNVCYGSSGLTEVNLPMLQTIDASGMESAFRGTNITQFNLPSLTTTTGTSSSESLCRDCTSLISVNLPELTTVGNYGLSSAFNGDTKLATINMPKVNSLAGNAFRYMLAATKVTNLSFPALKSTSFGSYTNQFTYMLSGVSNCTVHFPSNLRSVIGSWSDVTSGFGGTNTTVLFDLPVTS